MGKKNLYENDYSNKHKFLYSKCLRDMLYIYIVLQRCNNMHDVCMYVFIERDDIQKKLQYSYPKDIDKDLFH